MAGVEAEQRHEVVKGQASVDRVEDPNGAPGNLFSISKVGKDPSTWPVGGARRIRRQRCQEDKWAVAQRPGPANVHKGWRMGEPIIEPSGECRDRPDRRGQFRNGGLCLAIGRLGQLPQRDIGPLDHQPRGLRVCGEVVVPATARISAATALSI